MIIGVRGGRLLSGRLVNGEPGGVSYLGAAKAVNTRRSNHVVIALSEQDLGVFDWTKFHYLEFVSSSCFGFVEGVWPPDNSGRELRSGS